MDSISLEILIGMTDELTRWHFVFISRPILGIPLLEKIPKIQNAVHFMLKGMAKSQVHDMIVIN
jgi:hypothetical protein